MTEATTLDRLPLRVLQMFDAASGHAHAARSLRAVLETLCKMVEDPDEADIVIVHDHPANYLGWVQDIPALHQVFRIGACVCESEHLSSGMRRGIALMDEVWSPSPFCRDVFGRHHPSVHCITDAAGPLRERLAALCPSPASGSGPGYRVR